MDYLDYKPDAERFKTTGERPLIYHKFKQTVFCPFQNKLPLVNKLTGAMQLEATPCNELCPHFNVIETLNDAATNEVKFIDISISCSGTATNLRLVVEQEKDKEFATIMQR